jgi:hypothetical protein
MRNTKHLGAAIAAAAVIAAMTAIVSCSAAEGPLDLAGDDGTTGSYTISVAGGQNGNKITPSRFKANEGQLITINAAPAEASAWKGLPEDLSALKLGGGGVTRAAMMTTTLGI